MIRVRISPRAEAVNLTQRFSLQATEYPHSDAKISDRYVLSVLTTDSKYFDEAFRVCAEAFVDEPTSVHLEPNRNKRLKGWQQLVGHFLNETTIICIDQEHDKVASVLIMRDFAADLPPLLVDCVEHWKDPSFAKRCEYTFLGPILEVLVDVDEKYTAKCHPKGIERGVVMDLWMAGTDPIYRGQGLMTACTRKALNLARDKGFSEAIGECTGHYSASALCSLGAKPIVHTTYADFKLSNGTIGLEVDPPHTKLEILSFLL